MHRETVGFVDDHEILVLVQNAAAQRLGKHVGVDSLQLLCEPHQFVHSPLNRASGRLGREKEPQGKAAEDLREVRVTTGVGVGDDCLCAGPAPSPNASGAAVPVSPASTQRAGPWQKPKPPPAERRGAVLIPPAALPQVFHIHLTPAGGPPYLPPTPGWEPVNAMPLGSCGPFGLTSCFFVFCSCFWARSFSANRWALRVPGAAAAEQNGFETRVKRPPTRRRPEHRSQRPGALHMGAAIFSERGGASRDHVP